MRLYKIKALIKLGVEDLSKNMSVFIYVLFPLFFAFLYGNLDTPEEVGMEALYSICVLMNLAMVPVALMGTVIAEEKEKNTLRTLMLNDVKAAEVLLAKALMCVAFVVIDNILMYFILGLSNKNFLAYQAIGFAVGLAVILFGAFIGLFAKNQMSAGLLSMPFMVILMAPMFVNIMGNDIAKKIAEFLPTDAMMTMFMGIAANKITMDTIGKPIFVIVGWFVVSIGLFMLTFRKVGMDN